MDTSLLPKLDNEPQSSYESLKKYIELGGDRSIDHLPPNGLSKSTILRYYKKFDWERRAKQFDQGPPCKPSHNELHDKFASDNQFLRTKEMLKFERLMYKLVSLLNKDISSRLKENISLDSENILKIISSATKSILELHKIDFTNLQSRKKEYNENEIAITDDKARTLLHSLMERIREVAYSVDV